MRSSFKFSLELTMNTDEYKKLKEAEAKRKARNKLQYEKNKDKIKEANQKYRLTHKEELKIKNAERAKARREHRKDQISIINAKLIKGEQISMEEYKILHPSYGKKLSIKQSTNEKLDDPAESKIDPVILKAIHGGDDLSAEAKQQANVQGGCYAPPAPDLTQKQDELKQVCLEDDCNASLGYKCLYQYGVEH